MDKKISLVGIQRHQKLEYEVWVHYVDFVTANAPNRTNNPEEVTCPSCKRGLSPKKEN